MSSLPTTAVAPEALAAIGRAAGLDAVGFADAEEFTTTRATLEARKATGLSAGMQFTYRNPGRSTDPARALPGVRSLVVGARSYLEGTPSRPGSGAHGRVAAYVWSDHYEALRQGLQAIADELTCGGWRARVLVDDNGLVDREAAVRAGIGWYGKNTMVLLPDRGSAFVLGSVLTDAALPASPERTPDGCGSCTRCLTGCPTGALVEPGVLDARRCLAWLVQADGWFPAEHRVALGDRIYGCDECQDVCPPNRRESRVALRAPARRERAWVSLLTLLVDDDDSLMASHGQWYIPRRDPRFLRRNALVALGNVGDGEAADVVAVLRRYLGGPDELLRGHAVWAARRLGRADLCTALTDDPSPQVREELARPMAP